MSEKRSKRRWFQFSLRTLLLAVLVISLPLSWLAVKIEKARRQKEAVEAIRDCGGEVTYHYKWEISFAELRAPKWARSLFGDDFFFDVVRVDLIFGPNFADDEAIYPGGLNNLEALSLAQTQIRDAGLEHLEGLTELTSLDFTCTQITDAELEHLDGLSKLTLLDLFGTQITDAGLEHIKGLGNLEYLSLSKTRVTDTGLERLKGLRSLKALHLNDTNIKDAGLQHLKRMSTLRWLELTDTHVTAEGVKKLQEALPECEIYYSED